MERPITTFVRRRAWSDPRVRSWWVLALVLLVIAAYLAVVQYRDWSRLHRAVSSGVIVPARVDREEWDNRVGKKVSPGATVGITYKYNGVTYTQEGTLYGLNTFAIVGQDVPVHIDPKDPSNWTARNDTPSLAVAMVGALLVLPTAMLAGLLAVFARHKVLATYRHGQAVALTVASNRQTPLAPRSRAIKCALPPSGRLIEVFVPGAMASLAEGETVTVIVPPRGGRPIAAAWFEE